MTGETMSCAFLWDYLDGEPRSEEAERYREHLASCPACRLSLEEYSMIAEALRWEQREETPPAALRRGLMEEFRWRHPPTARGDGGPWWLSLPSRRLTLPAWAASVVLLGILALFYLAVGKRLPASKSVEASPRQETVAYQVYGPDGALRATVQTTRSREDVR
jgi:anti-sigma factor RsiW